MINVLVLAYLIMINDIGIPVKVLVFLHKHLHCSSGCGDVIPAKCLYSYSDIRYKPPRLMYSEK